MATNVKCSPCHDDATLLYSLRLGVAFTNAYSYRLGITDTLTCDTWGPEETMEHQLCIIPQFKVQRIYLRTVLSRLGSRTFSETKRNPGYVRRWRRKLFVHYCSQ